MSATEDKPAPTKDKKSKKEGKKSAEVKAEDTPQSPPTPAAADAVGDDLPDKKEEEIKNGETEKLELEKPDVADENVAGEDKPLAEIIQENFIRGFVSEAEKKSRELRLKILSQLYEVFRLFDIDRDGVIDETDLKFTFSSLGEMNVSEEKIQKMLKDSSTPIDFNAFVGMFESKEMEFDAERELVNAFSKWDTQNCGFIIEERLRNDLIKWGDKFSEKDADRALEEAPLYDESGQPTIDYVEFCANLCGLQNVRNSELFQERYRGSSKK